MLYEYKGVTYERLSLDVNIQENGIWKPAVIYCVYGKRNKLFVRSADEFNLKFIRKEND